MQCARRIINVRKISRFRFVGGTFNLNEISKKYSTVRTCPNFQISMATSMFNQSSNHNRIQRRTLSTLPDENELIDSVTFEKVCEETLDSLSEYIEELVENAPHLKTADVAYSSGVLTVNFGPSYGTYVINRQSPNRQIWLSSPVSGPKRYDYVIDGKYWIYKHDGKSLHQLLQDEIPKVVKTKLAIMEVMEDGNLMDKVHILIQRDLEYYKNNQSVLQETICPGVAGGRLDFPRNASFAAVKLALWWEDEYVAGFRKHSGLIPKSVKAIESDSVAVDTNAPIVKKSDPDKFISLVAKSSDQLLEHLHVLTQEALDHADLTVLMGTIGAASLLKNCLWFYIQLCTDSSKQNPVTSLQTSYKQYQEMGEALAERLLDMHCRLLSLYILQDAESLDWENPKQFFESERGSYVIQMWWLYMKGTMQDLWNSVPPKMAQRVLAGMLNESLTILAVRYTQAIPSENRSKLLVVDISNLLLCIAQLLPSICNSANEVIGLSINSQSKTLRDIHAKCQELLICLILRGTPLDVLYKVFRKGLDSIEILTSRTAGPSPWIIFGLPHIFPHYSKGVVKLGDLPDNAAIGLEIFVMLAQPQPNWALLLKVLGMRDGKVLSMLLNLAMKASSEPTNIHQSTKLSKCDGFLCVGDESCKSMDSESPLCTPQQYYDLIVSLTHVLLCIGNNTDFSRILLSVIDGNEDWAQCFDRRQVWNLNQPPWYKAILALVNPILKPIVPTVISAVQTGASMYQAMTIILACFIQLWDCVDSAVPCMAFLLQDVLPVDVVPLGKSALLQILVSALYSELLCKAEKNKKDVKFAEGTKDDSSSVINIPLKKQVTLDHRSSICSFDGTNSSAEAVSLAVAEALCSIDENNKHTEEIDDLLEQAKQGLEVNHLQSEGCKRVEQSLQMSEVLVSDLLMTPEGKKSLKTIYHFVMCNHEWLLQSLGVSEENKPFEPNRAMPTSDQLLHTMFHVGYRPFDQLLTGEWQPDWSSLFHIPMGLSMDRIWSQVSMRWEFNDVNTSTLSAHDARLVANLTNLLKQT